eukprot:GHVL01040391.1.p1 GENE.GHVL01040391.1~~GHVL01040391.1.p1  ORF type:complete len:180 (+),score=30.38 GHVL01040391.1:77-616(+)
MTNWSAEDIGKKIYVGGLDELTGPRELQDTFTQFGNITNVWVARQPPGFGFVTFEDKRDAEDAIAGSDSIRIADRRVKVQLAQGPRSNRSDRRRSNDRDHRRDDRRDDRRSDRYHSPPQTRRRSPSYGGVNNRSDDKTLKNDSLPPRSRSPPSRKDDRRPRRDRRRSESKDKRRRDVSY